MSDERIIVTGCSGFVGRNTVKMLLAQGHHVIGFSRRNPKIPGLEFIHFDITDARNFATSAYREATIINTAALTSSGAKGDFAGVNYDAVMNLLQLNPEGKFIHISSSSIYNLGKASTYIAEDEFKLDQYPFYNPYGASKAKAEHGLLTYKQRAVAPISLRPHAIYGEDDTTLIPKLRSRVRSGRLFLPDAGNVKHSLTHIDNLLQAIQLGLGYIPSKPEAFNITDGNSVTIATAAYSVLGASVKIKGIPTNMLLTKAAKLLGVSEYEVRQLGMERTYNLDKAKNILGYRPADFTVAWI